MVLQRRKIEVDVPWSREGDPLLFSYHETFPHWPPRTWTKEYFVDSIIGNFSNTYVSESRYFPYYDPTSIKDDLLFGDNFVEPFQLSSVDKTKIFNTEEEEMKYKL